ncbi:MAG: hypothetical protein E7300_03595 [Lachnospiraceae bacterium]|nr:hypothetical protein [Lachnospiraceae bacterium]
MAIKAFNVMNLSAPQLIDPNKVNYQDSIEIIKDELHHAQKSFVKIGWYLKHIDEQKMYEEDGYSDLYDFARDKFNITRTTASRFISICERFSVNNNSPELDDKYSEYGVSQLFEMLPMNDKEIEKVTPDMPVGKIRELKAEAKAEKKEKGSLPDPTVDDAVKGQYSFSSIDMDIVEDELPVDEDTVLDNELRETFSSMSFAEAIEIQKNLIRDMMDDILACDKDEPSVELLFSAYSLKETVAALKKVIEIIDLC